MLTPVDEYSVLAIDTAFDICSVACLTPAIAEVRASEHKRKHADDVLVMLHTLLQEYQLKLSGFDAIAMASGPGSFTGLRIGAAVVQGLAFGSQRPVVCISSLAALAAAAANDFPVDTCVATCVHAREDEFYFAIYRRTASSSPQCLLKDCIATPAQMQKMLATVLPASAVASLATGDGWEHEVTQALVSEFKLDVVSTRYDALVLADIARHELVAGNTVSAERASPVYLKDDLEYRTV